MRVIHFIDLKTVNIKFNAGSSMGEILLKTLWK